MCQITRISLFSTGLIWVLYIRRKRVCSWFTHLTWTQTRHSSRFDKSISYHNRKKYDPVLRTFSLSVALSLNLGGLGLFVHLRKLNKTCVCILYAKGELTIQMCMALNFLGNEEAYLWIVFKRIMNSAHDEQTQMSRHLSLCALAADLSDRYSKVHEIIRSKTYNLLITRPRLS